ATADRLRRELTPKDGAPQWRHLHLATHGYYSEKQGRGYLALDVDPQAFALNPQLSVGLVLAGVNRDAGQGMLTAAEVAGLDLRGVEPVVLATCDAAPRGGGGGEGTVGWRGA